MKFIELTTKRTDKKVWINMEHVRSLVPEDDHTKVFNIAGGKNHWVVAESVEEILYKCGYGGGGAGI